MTTAVLDILYGQLAVFDANLSQPFNNWTDQHVAQGFSWRPGSVSFSTIAQGGRMMIQIVVASQYDGERTSATRVIRVPFTVPTTRKIEIASISSGMTVDLLPGKYALTFEHGCEEDENMWANLYFVPVDSDAPPKIIRADDELHPGDVLLMIAEPA